MTTLNTLEGLADATTVTAGNSGGASGNAFDSVSGGANVSARTAAALAGSMGLRCVATGGSSYVVLSTADGVASTGSWFTDCLINFAVTTAVNSRIVVFEDNPGAFQSYIRTTTGNRLELRDRNDVTVATTASAGDINGNTLTLAAGTVYRIGMATLVFSTTVGQIEMTVWNSSGVLIDRWRSAANLDTVISGGAGRIRWGIAQAATRTIYMDNLGTAVTNYPWLGTPVDSDADTTTPIGSGSSPATSAGAGASEADTTAPVSSASSPAASAGVATYGADTTGPLGPAPNPARSAGSGAGVGVSVGAWPASSPSRSVSDASTRALTTGPTAYAASGLATSAAVVPNAADTTGPIGSASSPARSAGSGASGTMTPGAVAYAGSGLAKSDETYLTDADTTAPLGAVGSPARSVANAATAADTTAPVGAGGAPARSAGSGASGADTTTPLGGGVGLARSVGGAVTWALANAPLFGGVGFGTTTTEEVTPRPVDAYYVFGDPPVAVVVMDESTVVTMTVGGAVVTM